MRTLYEFIVESGLILEAFDTATGDFKYMTQQCPILNACAHEDAVEKLINILKKRCDIPFDNIFTFDTAVKYFKINRVYTDALSEIFGKKISPDALEKSGDVYALNDEFTKPGDTMSEFTCVKNGREMKVYIGKSKIFELGNGSVDRVKTADQENGTCIVWNRYINAINNSGDKKPKKIDIDFVKSVLKGFSDDWMDSFAAQVGAVYNFLVDSGETPEDYMMVRYDGDANDLKQLVGDNEVDDEKTAELLGKVGKSYANLIKAYIANYPESKKDNFDPSDVILYKVSEVDGKILPKLAEITAKFGSKTEASIKEGKDEFIEYLFKERLLFGISLKKVNSYKKPQCDLFNVNYNDGKSKVNVKKCGKLENRGKGIRIVCSGDFDFAGITSAANSEKASGEKSGGVSGSQISINMRTFGGNTVGIDCCVINGSSTEPALGKCPVWKWRDMLGVKVGSTLDECKEALAKKVNEWKKVKTINENLENIIKYAAKEGPACFPFILIH